MAARGGSEILLAVERRRGAVVSSLQAQLRDRDPRWSAQARRGGPRHPAAGGGARHQPRQRGRGVRPPCRGRLPREPARLGHPRRPRRAIRHRRRAAATGPSTPATYDLRPGGPDVGLFPWPAWARAAMTVSRTAPEGILQYGDPAGQPAAARGPGRLPRPHPRRGGAPGRARRHRRRHAVARAPVPHPRAPGGPGDRRGGPWAELARTQAHPRGGARADPGAGRRGGDRRVVAGRERRERGPRHTGAPLSRRRGAVGRPAACPGALGPRCQALRSPDHRGRLRRRVPVRPPGGRRAPGPCAGSGRLPRIGEQAARPGDADRLGRPTRPARGRPCRREGLRRLRLAHHRPAHPRRADRGRQPRPPCAARAARLSTAARPGAGRDRAAPPRAGRCAASPPGSSSSRRRPSRSASARWCGARGDVASGSRASTSSATGRRRCRRTARPAS